MTELIPQLLVLLPLASAVLLFLWHKPTAARRYAAAAILALLTLLSLWGVLTASGGTIAAVLAGGWIAPYGIVLVLDMLSALMLLAANLVFLSAVVYGFFEAPVVSEQITRLPLVFFLLTGVSLVLLTGDFFNLFVAFEVMLFASYALMVLTADPKKFSGAFTYIMFSMAASFLLLTAAALFYVYTGNLNLAAISLVLEEKGGDPFVLTLALLCLLVFGLKAGIFPLYFWLPDSYPALPPSLGGLFGGVLTKVSVYVLIRLFVTVFPHDLYSVYNIAGVLAGFTMLLGALGAVGQPSIRRILSYHILSQSGYMIFSLAMFTPKAIAAGIFFILHNIIVKASLFFLGGIGKFYYGTDSLKKMGGLWQALPLGGFLFLIQGMSLAGLPPFSGFWGKYLIFNEAMILKHWILVCIAIVTSFFTLFSMTKIWTMAYVGPSKVTDKPDKRALVYSSLLLVAVSLFLSLGAELVVDLVEDAGKQIFDRSLYIDAVYSLAGKGARQ